MGNGRGSGCVVGVVGVVSVPGMPGGGRVLKKPPDLTAI